MPASGTVGSLLIDLGINMARLQKDVADAKRTVDGAMKDIQSSAAKVAGALGVSLSVAGFTSWIKGAIDSEVQIGRLAQRAGESVETFSAFSYAMKKAGEVDAETLQSGMKKLDQKIGEAVAGGKEAQGVFRALGIAFRDDMTGGARKASDVMLDLAGAFSKAEDGPVKTAYAMKLMGKAGDEMIPGLNAGKEKLQELMTKAQEMGKVISTDVYEQARQFNQSVETLKSGSSTLARSIANDLLPQLNEMTRQMIEAKKEGGLLAMVWAALGGVVSLAADYATPMAKMRAEVKALEGDLKNLEDAKRGLSSSVNPGIADRYTQQIGEKKARLELLRHDLAQMDEDLRKKAEEANKAGSGKDKLDESGLRNQSEAEAELKRYISALQSLEKEYFNLTHEGKEALIVWETMNGSLRELTPAHKAELLEVAKKVDAYQKLLRIQQQAVAQVENEWVAVKRARDAITDHTNAWRADVDELEFSIGIIGRSARELEQLNAVRQADLDIRRRVAALPDDEGDVPSAATGAALQRILSDGEARKKQIGDLIRDRQVLERDWVTGAKSAFDEYVDEATNAASMTKQLFSDAFHGAEDAFVKFVTTGKFQWKDFEQMIAADLARMAYRKAVTGDSGILESAYKGLSSLAGSIFGGGRAGGGGVDAGTTYLVGENGPEWLVMGDQGGTVIPNGATGGSGGGGVVVYADCRGAADSAVARLVSWAQRMEATFEARSLSAVRNFNRSRGIA